MINNFKIKITLIESLVFNPRLTNLIVHTNKHMSSQQRTRKRKIHYFPGLVVTAHSPKRPLETDIESCGLF